MPLRLVITPMPIAIAPRHLVQAHKPALVEAHLPEGRAPAPTPWAMMQRRQALRPWQLEAATVREGADQAQQATGQ